MSERYGVVYFVGSRTNGPIKIGFTTDLTVSSRLAQLQTGSSEKLFLLGKIMGGPKLEQAIHNLLETHLVQGEWFEREAALAIMNRLHDSSVHHYGDFVLRLMDCAYRLILEDEDNTLEPIELQVARHLVSDMAHELTVVNTDKPLPLRSWLAKQRERDDPIGDLATDAFRDSRFPAVGNLEVYLDYVLDRINNSAVTRTVIEAWIECDIAVCRLPSSE
ncbi:MAG: YozE family protein [Candidatus Contendobacter sp.]|nr:YozE family protein [Candidatus Contendobacter sp.]MDG4558175.1 YozE family protein [Candidatus Contendobacter sp.]